MKTIQIVQNFQKHYERCIYDILRFFINVTNVTYETLKLSFYIYKFISYDNVTEIWSYSLKFLDVTLYVALYNKIVM